MYNPAAFVENRPEVLHEFMRLNPFAILISAGPAGLRATHVPMLLDTEAGLLRCHVARPNPHWQELAAAPDALVVFNGSHHYISPSWYASKKQNGKVVPTWNYVAVHVWGRARIFEDADRLIALVRKLTEEHESAFETPWSIDDAPAEYIEGMAKGIVGIEIPIERIAGKTKLSQNRSAQDRESAIAGLEELGTGASMEMAALMKKALREP